MEQKKSFQIINFTLIIFLTGFRLLAQDKDSISVNIQNLFPEMADYKSMLVKENEEKNWQDPIVQAGLLLVTKKYGSERRNIFFPVANLRFRLNPSEHYIFLFDTGIQAFSMKNPLKYGNFYLMLGLQTDIFKSIYVRPGIGLNFTYINSNITNPFPLIGLVLGHEIKLTKALSLSPELIFRKTFYPDGSNRFKGIQLVFSWKS